MSKKFPLILPGGVSVLAGQTYKPDRAQALTKKTGAVHPDAKEIYRRRNSTNLRLVRLARFIRMRKRSTGSAKRNSPNLRPVSGNANADD